MKHEPAIQNQLLFSVSSLSPVRANIGPILSIIPEHRRYIRCFISSMMGYLSRFFFIHFHAFFEPSQRLLFRNKTAQITSPARLVLARYYDISPVCPLRNPSSPNGVFLGVVGSHQNSPKMSAVPWSQETSPTYLMPSLLLDLVRFPKQRISSAITVPTELPVNKTDMWTSSPKHTAHTKVLWRIL